MPMKVMSITTNGALINSVRPKLRENLSSGRNDLRQSRQATHVASSKGKSVVDHRPDITNAVNKVALI